MLDLCADVEILLQGEQLPQYRRTSLLNKIAELRTTAQRRQAKAQRRQAQTTATPDKDKIIQFVIFEVLTDTPQTARDIAEVVKKQFDFAIRPSTLSNALLKAPGVQQTDIILTETTPSGLEYRKKVHGYYRSAPAEQEIT